MKTRIGSAFLALMFVCTLPALAMEPMPAVQPHAGAPAKAQAMPKTADGKKHAAMAKSSKTKPAKGKKSSGK